MKTKLIIAAAALCSFLPHIHASSSYWLTQSEKIEYQDCQDLEQYLEAWDAGQYRTEAAQAALAADTSKSAGMRGWGAFYAFRAAVERRDASAAADHLHTALHLRNRSAVFYCIAGIWQAEQRLLGYLDTRPLPTKMP